MPTYTGTDGNDEVRDLYDRMYGLGGNDRLLSQWGGQVYIDGGPGNDSVGFDWLTPRGWGEFHGGDGDDLVSGGDTANVDTIFGGSGDDSVVGDPGKYGRGGPDLIDAGDGRDAVWGDYGDDTIYGGDGDDSGPSISSGPFGDLSMPGLRGRDGNDYLDGGAGNDFLCGEEEPAAFGSSGGHDTLIGGSGDDELQGCGGNDLLDGGSGADTMSGGYGRDTYVVDSAADRVIEVEGDDADFASSGEVRSWSHQRSDDTVIALIDLTLPDHVENLILADGVVNGTGNALYNRLVGNALGNTLRGGDGWDTLDGGAGADTMVGGVGADLFMVDNAADVILEKPGPIWERYDRVLASVSYTLKPWVGVEVLSAIGGTRAIHLTGNSLDNWLNGNAAANRLNAGGGEDRLAGGSGNDRLWGGAGEDTLLGGAGDDTLTGGFGSDTLTGGMGRDVFAFDDGHTSANAILADEIVSFNGRAGDRIDLRAVDANALFGGDQAFTFIGKAGAFSHAGQVGYAHFAGDTYIALNTDADGAAEAFIQIKGTIDLSASWFML